MRDACANVTSANDQIAACTKLIDTRLLKDKELAQALYQRGLGFAELGQYQNAIRDFDQALKFAPDATDARFNRGAAFSKLGKWDQAMADFDALLERLPNDPNTLYARAWVLSQRGEDAAAIADLDQVLASRRTISDALLDRGGLNIRAGRYDDAIRDFAALLKLDPKAAAAAYNRGRALLCQAGLQERRQGFRAGAGAARGQSLCHAAPLSGAIASRAGRRGGVEEGHRQARSDNLAAPAAGIVRRHRQTIRR